MLEHDAAVRAGPGDRIAVHPDRAGLDRQKPADQIKQCGLAASRWPEQSDEFAVGDLERNRIERQHLASARRAIHMTDALDDDLAGPRHGGMNPP